MVRQISVGIIGLSAGNGHPFSFSCIINGYDDSGLKSSGWDGIYQYVKKRDASEFHFPGVQVTHVWTQDMDLSKQIAAAARIPNVVEAYTDMIGQVDAVIIARDDFEVHFQIAKPFLEAGCYVFVDKPLTTDLEELKFFRTYLQSGHLMSCSGLRYAIELDTLRASPDSLGELKLIRGAVLNDISKYGIHMMDAIFRCFPLKITQVLAVAGRHDSAILYNDEGIIIQIDALGSVVKTFQLDFFGTQGRFHAEINDNFSAFRRTLYHFFNMIKEGKPSIDPELTISIMKTIVAFNRSKVEGRTVKLSEIDV